MIGRAILLLLLIAILSVGGIIWFDYLNVIDAKTTLAPFYKYIPFVSGEGRTQPQIGQDEFINLDAERLAILIERMDARNLEMDARERDLQDQYGLMAQIAQELEDQKKAIEEMENSIRTGITDAENKDRNIEQNARYLTGMAPQNAVNIIANLNDQDAIDVLRKTEEIAQAEGTTSMVSVWLSMMEPARAAELQRKMAVRPSSL